MLFACAMFTSSCGSDVDCTDTTALNSEAEALSIAASAALDAYNVDQSEDNCNALKDAIGDFEDFLKDSEECIEAEDLDDYNETLSDIDEIQANLNC